MKKLIIILILLSCIKGFSQWTQISMPTNETLIDISFKNESSGFCIAENGLILRTQDGGNIWDIIQNNPSITYTNIIYYDDKLVAFGTENGNYYYYYSLDQGITWNSQISSAVPNVLGLLNNELYYQNFLSSSTLYRFNNNQPEIVATDVGIFGVNDVTNEMVYINNDFNTIYKSDDFGANWEELNNYPSGFGQNQSTNSSIKTINSTVVARYTYPDFLTYSIDDGNNWTEIEDNVTIGIYYFTNNGKAYGTNPSTKSIYVNTELTIWTEQSSLSETAEDIYFYNENLGFVIGMNGMLYRTENGGGLGMQENDTLKKKLKSIPYQPKTNYK